MANSKTLKRLSYLIFNSVRKANKTSKLITTRTEKQRYYHKKNVNIIKAVDIILGSRIKNVSYSIGFDEKKQMPYITFLFAKPQGMYRRTTATFHLIPWVDKEIKRLEAKYEKV